MRVVRHSQRSRPIVPDEETDDDAELDLTKVNYKKAVVGAARETE